MSIKTNLDRINLTIGDKATLVAVSKKQSLEKIQAALAAGQHIFAENYLQEALEKITALKDEKIEWHFIGHVQRNKTKNIAEHFAWVQSVDSLIIAERLNDQRPENLPPLNICIEVNISHDANKNGISPAEVFKLAEQIRQLPNLKLRGIMTIPSREDSAAFKHMQALFAEMQARGFEVDTLSMGMSADFEEAIAHGATMVRVGEGVFGRRE